MKVIVTSFYRCGSERVAQACRAVCRVDSAPYFEITRRKFAKPLTYREERKLERMEGKQLLKTHMLTPAAFHNAMLEGWRMIICVRDYRDALLSWLLYKRKTDPQCRDAGEPYEERYVARLLSSLFRVEASLFARENVPI